MKLSEHVRFDSKWKISNRNTYIFLSVSMEMGFDFFLPKTLQTSIQRGEKDPGGTVSPRLYPRSGTYSTAFVQKSRKSGVQAKM